MKFKITLLILAAFIIISCDNKEAFANQEGFSSWLNQIKIKALEKGIKKDTIDKAFAKINYKEKVVSLDKKQPERTIKFQEYKQKIIPQSRINKARKKLRENYKLLDQVEKDLGVQKRFIIALWAIESNFGQNMGGFYIPEALATLAYEGRRRDYFTEELINALKILDDGHVESSNFKGSWAGAMGQCQFMPSSFNNYAIDYNGDGRKDIWNTKADVFASAANYLKSAGWNDEYTWGRKVILTQDIKDNLISNKIEKPLAFWKSIGVKKANGSELPDIDINASLIDPDGDDGQRKELYLVYDNYKKIMKWNRSLFFATSVGILSDALR